MPRVFALGPTCYRKPFRTGGITDLPACYRKRFRTLAGSITDLPACYRKRFRTGGITDLPACYRKRFRTLAGSITDLPACHGKRFRTGGITDLPACYRKRFCTGGSAPIYPLATASGSVPAVPSPIYRLLPQAVLYRRFRTQNYPLASASGSVPLQMLSLSPSASPRR